MAESLNGWLRRHGVEQSFTTLAGLLGDAVVFVVDGDRNVLFWNEAAERTLGFTRDEVLGAHCLKGVRCATCITGCGVAERGTLHGVPVECHTRDGAVVRLRKDAQAFWGPDGRFAGAIEVLRPEAEREATGAVLEVGDPGDEVERFHGLLSRDPQMKRAFQVVRNVAETDFNVLIRGESGTGKELVARAIHAESHRRDQPFVAVNCAAFTPSLLESELFGHVKGAFTGAVSDRTGIFAQADGGTLFLDEVAELPLEVQAKLLRVLQERTFNPVGSTKPVKVDVRIVAATHKSLRAEVKAGRFREDLMFRLRVAPIFLPPLRERRADIELLLQHFIARCNERGPRKVRSIAPDAMRVLLDHEWRGNVRELQNVVQYASAVGRAPELTLQDLPPEFREAPAPSATLEAPPGEPTAEVLREALERAHGHVGRAAEHLGVSRPTFWRWRKRLGV